MITAMLGAKMGAERGAMAHAKTYAEGTVRGLAVTTVIRYAQTTVRTAAGTNARGARGAEAPVLLTARGAKGLAKIYARGAETPALRAVRGARGAITSAIRHVNSHVSGAMGARGAQGARIPAKTDAEAAAKTDAETTARGLVMARLPRRFIDYKISQNMEERRMKLILKDKREIKIDSVNNRYHLKSVNGKNITPTISLHIFDADPAITMDSIVNTLKDGNTTGFEVAYSDTETAKFDGWELSDVAEEITDNHRIITILATKIEAVA